MIVQRLRKTLTKRKRSNQLLSSRTYYIAVMNSMCPSIDMLAIHRNELDIQRVEHENKLTVMGQWPALQPANTPEQVKKICTSDDT